MIQPGANLTRTPFDGKACSTRCAMRSAVWRPSARTVITLDARPGTAAGKEWLVVCESRGT